MCSITYEPPTVPACIHRSNLNNAEFRECGTLCANVLSAEQLGTAERLATKNISAEERFRLAEWDVLETSAPALRHALTSLDCEITSTAEIGTHIVFSFTVRAAGIAAGDDELVYLGREYQRLDASTSALV